MINYFVFSTKDRISYLAELFPELSYQEYGIQKKEQGIETTDKLYFFNWEFLDSIEIDLFDKRRNIENILIFDFPSIGSGKGKDFLRCKELFNSTLNIILIGELDSEAQSFLQKDQILPEFQIYFGPLLASNFRAYRSYLLRLNQAGSGVSPALELYSKCSIHREKLAAIGEIAGGVAHEINNPLTVIHGNSEHILETLKSEKVDLERVAYCAEKIRKTSIRITKIVKSLRNFARDGGADSMQKTLLKETVEDAVDLCYQKFHERGASLDLIEKDPELYIYARSVEISQVVLNLLINSLDAVTGQDIKKVEVELSQDADKVYVRVIDTGIGISEDHRDKIMEAFFTTKDKGLGTGLGLSISSAIVRAHGGSLSEDLNYANRTCMQLSLPRYRLDD